MRHMRMKRLSKSGPLFFAIPLVLTTIICPAQTQTNIQQSAAIACAVMSGQRKADSQALHYILLADEDASEGNPVAIALHREVVKQCSQAYLNYQQRKRATNPFPPGSLVKQTPTQLTVNPTPDYPIRCRGVRGMASTDGKNLIVDFKKGARTAGQLQPGQCSWLDRAVRPNEPTRITDARPTPDEARNAAAHINAGDTWTFWVTNAGTSLKATASAKGTPNQKP
ncbi:MAG: hypothetical protein WAL56_14610 [Candidatus Sulfotelmatobacter sp.]